MRAGRVTVNGSKARSVEERYDREGLVLEVDGLPVSGEKYTCLMLHKPGGVVSATEDPRQKTVLDLLPPHLKRDRTLSGRTAGPGYRGPAAADQ